MTNNSKDEDKEVKDLVEDKVNQLREEIENQAEKRIEEETQELREEVQKLKTRQNTAAETDSANQVITRRQFLKKAGLGTAGLAALASPISALSVKSSSFDVFTNSGNTKYLSIGENGPVDIQNTYLDLNNQAIKNIGALGIPTTEASNNKQVWLDTDSQELKIKIGGRIYGAEMRPLVLDSSLSDIQYRYPLANRDDNVVAESISGQDATAVSTSNIVGNYSGGYAEQGNGTDAYIDMPTAITEWADTTGKQWMAFTIEDIDTDGDILTVFNSDGVSGSGTERWRIRIDSSGSELYMRAGVGGISGPGNNRTTWVTTDANLTDGKHRIFIQKVGADTAEFWIDGSKASVSTSVNENGWSGFYGDPSTFKLACLARKLDDGSTDSHTNSVIDNLIFGAQGTNKTSSEIQADYNDQLWT